MKPKIKHRICEVDEKIELPDDIPPLLRRLYISRGVYSSKDLDRSLKGIISWKQLSGIERAVSMLYKALRNEERIIVVGDFDTDGATSTALGVLSLQSLGCKNISYLVPNRFKNGYGLSQEIVEQAYYKGAQVIMTVDNGISSHDGVNLARKLGISVLITDHHLPGRTLPAAEAIIDPNLRNCNFPSKYLAGVGVVFYLVLALRAFLHENNWFKERGIAIPNLTKYLDLVALGTVADVVPLDTNNRILIWQGLNRIRAGKCCYGIKALIEISNRNCQKLMTKDLSFFLGPLLNSAGRLNDMSVSVALLLCENFNEAKIIAHKLNMLNQARKNIEQIMELEALELCESLKQNRTDHSILGLVIYHPNWHQGIIGILASRIKERFHRPVIAFAPIGGGIFKGSGRSIHGLHMLSILEQLNTLYPNLILKFGGHAMAVGLLIEEKYFEKFKYLFNELLIDWLDPASLQNEIISDGPLSSAEMTMEVAKMINDAGPWGQMFPEPIFDGYFYLLQQQLISKKHLKVVVKPIGGGPLLDGITFNVDTDFWPDKNIQEVQLTYKLDINEFRGNSKLQIIVNSIWPT